MRGHAIEVRLYAEEPAQDWRPSTGTLHRFAVPHGVQFGAVTEAGVRLDSAVTDGSVVSPHYDPMLAKVIAWAPTRPEAARSLASALARAQLHRRRHEPGPAGSGAAGGRVRRRRYRHRIPRPAP